MGKKPYNFRLDEKLMEQAKKLADKELRSLTNFIESLVQKAVENAKKKKV